MRLCAGRVIIRILAPNLFVRFDATPNSVENKSADGTVFRPCSSPDVLGLLLGTTQQQGGPLGPRLMFHVCIVQKSWAS
jgi:hypothetical protein